MAPTAHHQGNGNRRPRVGLVVQRCGVEVNGGAEVLCRSIGELMSEHWDIDVLTSRSRDYVYRFENEYEEGLARVGSLPVRRFTIDYLRSDPAVFSALDRRVLARESTPDEDNRWLREVGPNCTRLRRYLEAHGAEYDLLVFFTYLYATTTLVLPAVRARAVLVPTAHDEPPIYARPFDELFRHPRALLCNTPEEAAFLERRTGGHLAPVRVVGVGVDGPARPDPAAFRARHGIEGEYVLCVGRIQREKGCDLLFENYLALSEPIRRRHPLVLLGKATMEIPSSPHIRALGFLSDEDKTSAMAGATMLIAPSPYESLSLVLLEAWTCGTPALVNGRCDVLRNQCRRAQAGLWYDDGAEFQEAFAYLVDPANRSVRRQLGENGRRFVEAHYRRDVIANRYMAVLEEVRRTPTGG
jgi:glycosyltransferase involved in cell wall biosynthesis